MGIPFFRFWLGIALGRLLLGFLTPHLGENPAITLYLLLCLLFTLLYSFIPSFPVSAVCVALLGFFLGPMFPAAIVATTKLLPQRLHVSSITFAAAVAGGGACVFPFVVGAVAQRQGVGLLRWFIIAMLGGLTLVWVVGVPRISNSDRKGKRKRWWWWRRKLPGVGRKKIGDETREKGSGG